jgi:hypothetical protein
MEKNAPRLVVTDRMVLYNVHMAIGCLDFMRQILNIYGYSDITYVDIGAMRCPLCLCYSIVYGLSDNFSRHRVQACAC